MTTTIIRIEYRKGMNIMSNTFEYASLNITIPIILRCRKRAPERCVRNLMELGELLYKHYNSEEKTEIYQELLLLCKGKDQQAITDYFMKVYHIS